MSAVIVRQALEFVDPDESSVKRKKRGGRPRRAAGQEFPRQLGTETKANKQQCNKRGGERDCEDTQEVITKLLKLSEPTVDKEIAKKIVKRAVTGKPVFDKIKTKKVEQKSILFPEDNHKKKSKPIKKKKAF